MENIGTKQLFNLNLTTCSSISYYMSFQHLFFHPHMLFEKLFYGSPTLTILTKRPLNNKALKINRLSFKTPLISIEMSLIVFKWYNSTIVWYFERKNKRLIWLHRLANQYWLCRNQTSISEFLTLIYIESFLQRKRIYLTYWFILRYIAANIIEKIALIILDRLYIVILAYCWRSCKNFILSSFSKL